MKAVDWMVDYLIKQGCSDVFGIPGVVVMDFLYAVDSRKPDITPHLSYHEQGAAYAACGYAQATGKLGVAYSTRGPGFTNMVTAIADAYYDSIPTLFITAHSAVSLEPNMRVLDNQEINTVGMVKSITKYALRVDSLDMFQNSVAKACECAITGRKGPVFLDIYNGLFAQEVSSDYVMKKAVPDNDRSDKIVCVVESEIKKSKRPVILIGNGVRNDKAKELLSKVAEKFNIPVLSSRSGQDVIPESGMYFGFVGSRATRYSNFILSKTDLIISLGNRMAFPVKSKSFSPVVDGCRILRIDIDDSEFLREIPNCKSFKADVETILYAMLDADLNYSENSEWINVCEYLRDKLNGWDSNTVIENLTNLMRSTSRKSPFVCDVGNHSFWETTAYAYSHVSNRVLYSGSFGALGSALPKSIGAFCATQKPVLCFVGDQGIQLNIQELQFIARDKLPITVVILNNSSSGMIMEREIAKHGDHLIHTTTNDGYSFPDFEKIAYSYGIDYQKIYTDQNLYRYDDIDLNRPRIIEMIIDVHTKLEPSLPIGKPCQDLSPELPRVLYEELDRI